MKMDKTFKGGSVMTMFTVLDWSPQWSGQQRQQDDC